MNYITFTAGDKDYKLVLNTRAMVELEKKIGCNPIDILVAAQDDKLPKIQDMVAILWASLLKFNHGYKFDDCYDIFDDYIKDGHNIVEFLEVMVNIFKVSGIITDEEKSPNAVMEEN